ncbi:MAG: hypothetical protein V4591_07665 [Bdellovibrionota bacterium]
MKNSIRVTVSMCAMSLSVASHAQDKSHTVDFFNNYNETITFASIGNKFTFKCLLGKFNIIAKVISEDSVVRSQSFNLKPGENRQYNFSNSCGSMDNSDVLAYWKNSNEHKISGNVNLFTEGATMSFSLSLFPGAKVTPLYGYDFKKKQVDNEALSLVFQPSE